MTKFIAYDTDKRGIGLILAVGPSAENVLDQCARVPCAMEHVAAKPCSEALARLVDTAGGDCSWSVLGSMAVTDEEKSDGYTKEAADDLIDEAQEWLDENEER